VIELTWVVDNVAEPSLRAEHGLAIWIETPSGDVLLDTGASGEVLLHNLAALGLDPARLDAVVLSHAHDDHTGGLAALLPLLRPRTPLYAHPTIFRRRFSEKSGEMQSRGLPLSEAEVSAWMDVRLSEAPVAVLPEVWTTGEIRSRNEPEGRSPHHSIHEGGAYVADPYTDDLSLVLRSGPDRCFLLCGCCHAGLLNTMATVREAWRDHLVGVGGGVHLTGAAPDLVQRTATTLRSLPYLEHLWLGHCSGDAFLAALEANSGDIAFRRGAAGQRLHLGV
jgi:7,8-dihydropterin-6-yl-methyl-4-(beta-D-ribofuranosyl)aminobenzene 5'-phosphate synthase